jgi:hypothetical protein
MMPHLCDTSTSPKYKEAERIVITGMGFTSPVGVNVWETALALRKKRSAFFAHETVLVADDRYGTVLRGATVSRMRDEIVSRRLCGTDRAVALLSAAIRECTAKIPPDFLRTLFWQIDNLLEPTDRDFPDRLQKALSDIPFGADMEETPPGFSRCGYFERINST